jgi:hypothetical protein
MASLLTETRSRFLNYPASLVRLSFTVVQVLSVSRLSTHFGGWRAKQARHQRVGDDGPLRFAAVR